MHAISHHNIVIYVHFEIYRQYMRSSSLAKKASELTCTCKCELLCLRVLRHISIREQGNKLRILWWAALHTGTICVYNFRDWFVGSFGARVPTAIHFGFNNYDLRLCICVLLIGERFRYVYLWSSRIKTIQFCALYKLQISTLCADPILSDWRNKAKNRQD